MAAGRVRPLGVVATTASLLLGVMAALCLLVCVTSALWAQAANDHVRGVIDDRELDDAAFYFVTALVLFIVGVLATGVAFITWQYRHARNADALGGRIGLGPGWAIGGWFIPLVNVLLAAVQLAQASRASDPSLAAGVAGRGGRANPRVVLWAVAFGLACLLIGPWPSPFGSVVDSAGDDAAVGYELTVGYFVLAVAAVLGIVMVRSLTTQQMARWARVTDAEAVPGEDSGATTPVEVPVVSTAGLVAPPVTLPVVPGPAGTPQRAALPWLISGAVVVVLVFVGASFQGVRDDRNVRIEVGGNTITPATDGDDVVAHPGLLEIGDCFNGLDLDATDLSASALRRRSCTLPHDAEVFAKLELTEGPSVPFPGDAEVSDRASQMCQDEFAAYVGTDYVDSPWEFVTFWPDELGWNEHDDRRVICSLIDPRLVPIEGSLRDSGTEGSAEQAERPAQVTAIWTSAVVDPGGPAIVTEVIDYDFGTQLGKHGILRHVPGLSVDDDVTVRSEDAPDDVLLTPTSVGAAPGVEIRIGDPDIEVSGHHSYTLRYPLADLATGSAIDWEAVGTEWSVPIGSAEIHVTAPFVLLDIACYQGEVGSTEPCTIDQTEPGHLVATTGELAPGEGISIEARLGDPLPVPPDEPQPPA